MRSLLHYILFIIAFPANLLAKEFATPIRLGKLSFVENSGQITDQNNRSRNDIDFSVSENSTSIFISKGGISYQFTKESAKNSNTVNCYRVDMKLLGANKNAALIKEELQTDFEVYYLPQCPDGAIAKSYKKITYKNVYPLIDWVLYSDGQHLKYDFIVHKGGNPENIKLLYSGAKNIVLNNGRLIINSPLGSIIEEAPYTYSADTKQPLISSYKLNGSTVSFNIQPYNGSIVIDPTFAWSTFYGGTHEDKINDILADNAGNTYATGYAFSTTNIATTGSYQSTIGGNIDAFLVKFNTNGVRQWATYYGGTGGDLGSGLSFDKNGNIYMCGTTSGNFATTTGVQQTTYGGGDADLFLAKFTPAGTRIWATYYGGVGTEKNTPDSYIWKEGSVACDTFGNVYLAASTNSTSGIATTGSHKFTKTGVFNDGLLVKFNSSGIRQWGTYFGGDNDERCTDIAVDAFNNIYVIGTTYSTNNIASGIHSSTISHGTTGYLMKFDTTGNKEWGFPINGLGGLGSFTTLCIDQNNNIYCGGHGGNSRSSFLTPNAAQKFGGQGMLAKFDKNGYKKWATLFGGGSDIITGVAVNAYGNLFITGASSAVKYLATPCAFQPNNLKKAAFLAVYDTLGTKAYATHFGIILNSIIDHYSTGMSVTCSGKDVFFAGFTDSLNNISISASSHQQVQGGFGWTDGFIAKFAADTSVDINQPFTDTMLCVSQPFALRYSTTFSFKPGNVFIAQLSDASGSFSSPTVLGTDTSQIGGYINCQLPGSLTLSGAYRIRIVSTNPAKVSCNNGSNILLSSTLPAHSTLSSNGPVCIKDTLKLSFSNSNPNVLYYWEGPDMFSDTSRSPKLPNTAMRDSGMYVLTTNLYGCKVKDSINVIIKPLPVVNATSNSPVCIGDSMKLFATANPGSSYSWSGPGSYVSSLQTPHIAVSAYSNTGNYIVSATFNGCTSKDTVAALVGSPVSKPIAINNGPVCAGDTLKLSSSSSTTNCIYTWSGPSSFIASQKDTNILQATAINAGNYIVQAYKNGCIAKDTTIVTIKPLPAIVSKNSNSPVCPGLSLNLNCTYNLPGITYSWTGPGGFANSAQSPSRAGMTTALAGSYIVNATLNGCTSVNDTLNVAVVSSTPTPVASANTPVCIGQDLTLNASTVSGATYQWISTAGFSSSLQNPVITSATTSVTGKYYVRALLNNCYSPYDSVSVTVVPAPAINVYPSPKDSICQGNNITFVSSNSNAGTTYTRTWFKNNNVIGGAANANYSTTAAADKDEYFVTLTTYGVCATPYTDTSNKITVHVLPWLAPGVSITANPNTTVPSGTMINFTALPVNGGAKPTYQWTRNGANITGALSNVWGASTLSNNDLICVEMTSNYMCPNPKSAKSNCIKVSIESTGVAYSWTGKEPQIYPNPTKEILVIEGLEKETKIQLNDVIGTVLYNQICNTTNTQINTANLVPGNYVLLLKTKDGNSMIVKIVKE